MTSEADLHEFVTRHKVCWEVQALREMVKDEGVRSTGLELNLFAQCGEPPAGTAAMDWVVQVHSRTAAVAEQVLPRAASGMHVEIEPPHDETHLRPEAEWVTEVEVRVLLTPNDPEAPPSPQALSALVAEVGRAMAALGVRPRSWPASGR